MADNNMGQRFSEEMYATKAEVAKILNTSLIDGFWNNILTYRRQYMHSTSLIDISKARYQVTYCSTILDKSTSLESKFSLLNETVMKYKEGSLERHNIESRQLKSILYAVAKQLEIPLNDVALNNILNRRDVDKIYQPVVSYYRALLYIETHPIVSIDEDLLASFYSLLNGEGELTSFYRMSEFKVHSQKILINREYMGAPVRLIEELMESTLDYIANDSNLLATRLAAIYYMLDYIKPFEQYNELMSVLIAKALLSKVGFPHASIVSLEQLFAEKADKFRVYSKEVQKTRDLTYVLAFISDEISKEINDVLNIINRLELSAVRDEYYMGDSNEEYKEEFGIDMPKRSEEEFVPIEEPSPTKVEEEVIKEEPVVEPIKEEYRPSIEETKPVEPRPRPVKKEPTIMAKAINGEDRTLKQLEEDMLESDPELRPHQAHFYVRHNTFGKFYTIQQYKKSEGVVYETARTSMDNLAKKGYYRREQVKNKFVYTPVKLD